MKRAFRILSAVVLLGGGVALELCSFGYGTSLKVGDDVYGLGFAVGADVCLLTGALLFKWKRPWVLVLLVVPLIWTLKMLFDVFLMD